MEIQGVLKDLQKPEASVETSRVWAVLASDEGLQAHKGAEEQRLFEGRGLQMSLSPL